MELFKKFEKCFVYTLYTLIMVMILVFWILAAWSLIQMAAL